MSDHDALARLLAARRSVRAFKPDPVPRETIAEILRLAQLTASNNNCQPWQAQITSGGGTERFRQAYLAHVAGVAGNEMDYPYPEYDGVYKARRVACGYQLYGALGIARDDKQGRAVQGMKNFDFFGAPHVAMITSDRPQGPFGVMDCGAFIATFMLAAQSLGVASCAQVALATQAPFVRSFFGLGEDRVVICGISFGYADENHPANGYRTARAAIDETTAWIDA